MRRKIVCLPDGAEKPLAANINSVAANALYETVLEERPKHVIEIGMAQGVSTRPF